jgi:hypothetical protein
MKVLQSAIARSVFAYVCALSRVRLTSVVQHFVHDAMSAEGSGGGCHALWRGGKAFLCSRIGAQ